MGFLGTACRFSIARPDWLASPLQDTDFAVQNPILLGEHPLIPLYAADNSGIDTDSSFLYII